MAKGVDLEAIKARLKQRKEEAQVKLEKIQADLQRRSKPLDKDFAEQAVERENDEVLQQLAQSNKQEILQINKALARIEEGEYTHCSHCGDEIPFGRLDAIPFTTLCVRCAEIKG